LIVDNLAVSPTFRQRGSHGLGSSCDESSSGESLSQHPAGMSGPSIQPAGPARATDTSPASVCDRHAGHRAVSGTRSVLGRSDEADVPASALWASARPRRSASTSALRAVADRSREGGWVRCPGPSAVGRPATPHRSSTSFTSLRWCHNWRVREGSGDRPSANPHRVLGLGPALMLVIVIVIAFAFVAPGLWIGLALCALAVALSVVAWRAAATQPHTPPMIT
jgi:hypothetical protein